MPSVPHSRRGSHLPHRNLARGAVFFFIYWKRVALKVFLLLLQLVQSIILSICFGLYITDVYISITCLLQRLLQRERKGWLNITSPRAT